MTFDILLLYIDRVSPTLTNGCSFYVLHFINRIEVILVVEKDAEIIRIATIENYAGSHVVGLIQDNITSEECTKLGNF